MTAARKQWRELRRFLTDRRVLAELHHLLWREPFTNSGNRDEGWMCRDHSFFTASLAALLGHQSTMMWGRLVLVGTTVDGHVGMLRVDTHSWTGVEGYFDLSLNIELGSGPGWARWPACCLAVGWPRPLRSNVQSDAGSENELRITIRHMLVDEKVNGTVIDGEVASPLPVTQDG
jgi:hypothetical protein